MNAREEAVRLCLRALLCVALLVPGVSTHAQTWPSRPIKLIVPTGPGAATDVMARLLADGISQTLGQPVIVDNMPGASGIVAHQAVARALADGYTLLFTNTSGLAINLVTFKKLSYDPAHDFKPVAMVCSLGPQMLSVNAELPVRSMQEFIAYAKARRGALSMGFDNTSGAAAFAAKLINKRADLGLVEVPYRSAAQMTQDIAGGTTQVMISSIAAARSVVEAGKVLPIGITSANRFPGLPDLPPISETVPGVVINGWFVVVAPANTPPNVVSRLNGEIGEYLKGPAIQRRLLDFGLATEGGGTPESTAQFIRREQDNWRALAKELAIEPQ
jgi:tripartite-type tricarboxylate transporter receptor subunit TctC